MAKFDYTAGMYPAKLPRLRLRPRILALFGARVIFGAERENIESLAALRDQGCDVLCLVRHEDWNEHVTAALDARNLAWRKVPYIDGWLRGWMMRILLRNPIAFLAGNWRFIKIVREFRPTHIYAFNSLYILSFLAALVLMRTPMIYRAGEQPVIHRRIWRLLWRFVVARTRCFVPVSSFIADELKATGVRAERIEVLYAVPPKRVGTEAASRAIPAPAGPMRDIVFVGQVTESKGLLLLVEAFRSIAPSYLHARLLIAGRISEWKGDQWARDLRDYVAHDHALCSRVIFLGFVENVPELLRGREVLVAPSLVEEGLPLVVMEAKAAGLPAIVFPSGGLPEMIRDDVDGIVCREKSVAALVSTLKYYLNDPSVAARHGAAARASLDRLGVHRFADRWLALCLRTR